MKENMQLFARISGKTVLAWFKVMIPGGILFLVSLIAAIVLFSDNKGPGFSGGGHAGGIGAIIGLFLLFGTEFRTTLLLFGSIGCIIFYIAFANKYALQTAIHQIWISRLSGPLMDKADHYIKILSDKQPGWMKQAGTAAHIKLRLLQSIKEDKTVSSFQRRILGYAFKKAELNETDFSGAEVSVASVIKSKLEEKLNIAIAPSMKLFRIVALLQIAVLVLALIYNHR